MLKESTCLHCGSSRAHVHYDKGILSGAYGSSRFDTTMIAPTGARQTLEEGGVYCDGCVKAWVDRGEAYPYTSALREIENRPISAEAYSIIFEYHAKQAIRMLGDNGVEVVSAGGNVDTEKVVKLRGSIDYDPSTSQRIRFDRLNYGNEAIGVAQAHVLAAQLLGSSLDEGAILLAAREFGEKITAVVESQEELFQYLEREFGGS